MQRVQEILNGKVKDPWNLFRDCRKQGLKDPREMTQLDLNCEVWICTHEISRLAKQAHYLCHQHLKQLVQETKQRGDEDKARQILNMLLKKEAVYN